MSKQNKVIPYQELIDKIESYKHAKTREKAYAANFLPKPKSKMDELGLKMELGLKTREAIKNNTSQDKLSFENFEKKLAESKIKPVLERNKKGDLEINYDIYAYDRDKQKVAAYKMKGNELPNQSKVYRKVDVSTPYKELLQKESRKNIGEQKTDDIAINPVDKATLEKREDLKTLLEKNIKKGREVKMEVKDGKIQFAINGNKNLGQALNRIPNQEALNIVEKHNNVIRDIQTIKEDKSGKETSAINQEIAQVKAKNDFSKDIEEAYPLKQDTEKKQLKL